MSQSDSENHADAVPETDPRRSANGDWYWNEMLEVPFVLADGSRAILMLPPDGLSQGDADRLAAMVTHWALEHVELGS